MVAVVIPHTRPGMTGRAPRAGRARLHATEPAQLGLDDGDPRALLHPQLGDVAKLGDPVGERRRNREHRNLVLHVGDFVAPTTVPVSGPARATRSPTGSPSRSSRTSDLEVGAHPAQHVHEPEPGRVQVNAFDRELGSGVTTAATTKNAADDGSPGTSRSNGRGAPAATRTLVGPVRSTGAPSAASIRSV